MKNLGTWLAILALPLLPASQAASEESAKTTWLQCNWTTSSHSFASKGAATSEDHKEGTRSAVFQFNPTTRRLYKYDLAAKTLDMIPDSMATEDHLVVHSVTNFDSPDRAYHSESDTGFQIDRRTLQFAELSQATTRDTVIGASSQIISAGTGTCKLIAPQELRSNQF